MNDYYLIDDEWLTIPDLVPVFKRSKSALHADAKAGRLPGVIFIGKSVRVSKRALEKWLGRQLEGVER